MTDKNKLYDPEKVINYHINRIPNYTTLTRDDMYQIAYEAYLRCQNYFDEQYGTISLNYVSKAINEALYKALRKESKFNLTHSDIEDKDYRYIMEDGYEPRNDDEETMAKIEEAIKKLDPTEQYIIHQMHLADHIKRVVDLSDELGVSKQAVSRRRINAFEKLRKILEDDNYRD